MTWGQVVGKVFVTLVVVVLILVAATIAFFITCLAMWDPSHLH